jgi:hypothetical protein
MTWGITRIVALAFSMFVASGSLAADLSNEAVDQELDALPADLWRSVIGDFRYGVNLGTDQGLVFSYAGPAGWSSPEWRIVIRRQGGGSQAPAFSAEMIKLKVPLKFLVAGWYADGTKDKTALLQRATASPLLASSDDCPELSDRYRDVIAGMAAHVGQHTASATSVTGKPELIRLDGGASWDFSLIDTNGDEETHITTMDYRSPLVATINALGTQIKQCSGGAKS